MVDHCDSSLPTMTVSFCAKDCDNPLGSVEVIPPMRVINSGFGAYAVIDTDRLRERVRAGIIAFADAFDAP